MAPALNRADVLSASLHAMRLLLADYRQALAELDLPRLDTLAKQGEALADRIPRRLAATDGPLTDPSVLADRKSTRLNSSHIQKSRMPSSA